MTAAGKQNKPETPAERRAKVEKLLQDAAVWEPETPPTDFVAKAMRRQQNATAPVKRRRFLNRWQSLWWSFGTVGVAAASVLFTMTGKMPLMEAEDVTPTSSPAAIVAVQTPTPEGESTVTPVASVSPKQSKSPQTEPQVSAKAAKSSAEVAAAPTRSYRRGGTRSFGRSLRRSAHSESSTERTNRVAATAPKQPAANPAPTAARLTPKVEAVASQDVYTTEDGRMLVPVILTHTSEDGSEVSYTPAVVEMAYQPVDGTP